METITVSVDGQEITGFLHFPEQVQDRTLPGILLTNGSDFFMVELLQDAQPLLERGIVVLTFDIPGIGASREVPLSGDSSLHQAFLEVLLADDRVDNSRIAAMGVSMGGNLSARLAFERPDDVVAAINVCGPIERVTQVPLEIIEENFPPMSVDALWSRFGQNTNDRSNFYAIFSTMGLVSTGLIKEGEVTSVPILSVNTDSDPANPLWEMNLLTEVSEGGKTLIAEGVGHCPAQESPVEMIDWIDNILNSQT